MIHKESLIASTDRIYFNTSLNAEDLMSHY